MSSSIHCSAESSSAGVVPAGCAAEAPASAGPVCVLGALGYDFGSFARRDAFDTANGNVALLTNSDLSNYLVVTPSDADQVIWTLSIDDTPVYAVKPVGPFAKATYQRLQALLLDPSIEVVSVTGHVNGRVTLLNGQVVPVIAPDPLGLRAWSGPAIVPPAGHLEVSLTALSPGAQSFLTGEGSLDWAHWGLSAPDDEARKLAAALPDRPIGNQLSLNRGSATRQVGYRASFRWNDGVAPVVSFTTDPSIAPGGPVQPPGFLQAPAQSAFTLSVPADEGLRVLRVYLRNDGGPSGGACRLTASLTGVPGTVSDETLVVPANQAKEAVATITFRTPPGTAAPATLTVTWQALATNLAGLQAAALHLGAPTPSTKLQSYLDRIHFDLRNMGVTAQERALNFAATYAATQALPRLGGTLFGAMFAQGAMFEGCEVSRNSRCRAGGNCWDLVFSFFYPAHVGEWSRWRFRLTVDVGAVKPLIVGQLQRFCEP